MKNILLLLFLTVQTLCAQHQIKLSVTIQDRKSDTLYVGQNDFKQILVAGSKGNFNGVFAGPAGKYYLVNGTDHVDVYFENGFDLTITADGKDLKKSMAFKGRGAKENILFARQKANSLATEMDIADGIEDLVSFTKGSEKRLKQLREAAKDKALTAGFRKLIAEDLWHDEHNFPTMSQYQFKRQHLNGKPLPDFSYTNHDGGTATKQDFRGKYILIDIWATWSRRSYPEGAAFDMLELEYRNKNIAFLSISIDRMEDLRRWKETVTARELAGVQLICDKEFESEMMKELAVDLVPRFIIVGPDGIIIDGNAPGPSSPALAEELDKLLN
ncbi:TlpA family protein disulfide reductase [Flavobacterium sp.]|uniref:TlpA family protein disulfide reductase n=1 Tax=Flavobacterium sp. TaxID=239 RepID=UPI004033D81C